MLNRYILVYSGNIVIPDMAAWVVRDITEHGMSVVKFQRKVYCNTTIQVLLSASMFDDVRTEMYDRYRSPKKIIAVMVAPPLEPSEYAATTPGIDERIKQVHTGISQIDSTQDLLLISESFNQSEFTLWDSLLF